MRLYLALLLVLIGSLPGSLLAQPAVDRPRPLVMGYITDNPRKQYRKLKPIADYLAGHLAEFGIRGSELVFVKTPAEMVGLLQQGQVDWVSESAFGTALFVEQAGARPLLVRKKGGGAQYYSIIFSRRDSGVETLADLRGRRILFEDAGSTSAYFIPRLALVEKGMELQSLNGPWQTPAADKVGFLFSLSERNSVTWVHQGVAEAGAVSNKDWLDSDTISPVQKQDLQIIYQSPPYPRAIESVGAHVTEAMAAAMTKVLVNSPLDLSADEALSMYHKTFGFEVLDDSDWQALARVAAQIDALGLAR